MSEEVEGLFSTISFVVDDKGFKKLEDYLFLASATFSELNVKTEEYEDNLKRIAKVTRELSGLRLPKIPKQTAPIVSSGSRRASNDLDIGSLGRESTRFGRPRDTGRGGGRGAGFASGLEGFGAKAGKISPLLSRLGAVGLAFTAISVAVSATVKALSKFAQTQSKILNQSQLLASSLGLQQSQILGLADAYKTLGLDSSQYLNAVKGVQDVQAGLALGRAPLQQLTDLAVAGVEGGAGALLTGDTDKLISLIGKQVNQLESMGEAGKKQLAVLNSSFPELVKEAKARELSQAQTGRTPAQIARELTQTRFRGIEGGEKGLAARSSQFNLALERLQARFTNIFNIVASSWLPILISLTNWLTKAIDSLRDFNTFLSGKLIEGIDTFKQSISEFFDNFSKKISDFMEKITDPISSFYNENIKPVVEKAGEIANQALLMPDPEVSTTGFQNFATSKTNNTKNDVKITVNANGVDAHEVARILQSKVDQASQSSMPLGN